MTKVNEMFILELVPKTGERFCPFCISAVDGQSQNYWSYSLDINLCTRFCFVFYSCCPRDILNSGVFSLGEMHQIGYGVDLVL